MKIPTLLCILLLLVGTLTAQLPADQTSGIDETEKEVLEAIPITRITFSADETISSLNKIRAGAEPKQSIISIEERIPQLLDSLNTLKSNPIFKNLSGLNIRVLQDLSHEWSMYFKQLEDLKKTVETRTHELEEQGHNLEEMSKLWQLTFEMVKEEEAPLEITDRVKSILDEIKNVDKQLSQRLNQLLVLQDQLSKEQIKIKDLSEQIKNAEKEVRNKLFIIDSPRLWDAFQTEEDSLEFASQFQSSWQELYRSNVAFVIVNENRFYLHLAIYVFLIILMIYLNQRNKRDALFAEEDEALKASAYFVSRPLSVALLIALILSIWIYPEETSAVLDLLFLLLLIPVLRLIPGILSAEVRGPVYIFYGLIVINILQKNAIGFVLVQRLLLLVVTTIALATLIWLLRPGSEIYEREDKFWSGFIRKGSAVLILCLFVALIANLIGSVSLANFITWGTIKTTYVLITLYIAVSVANGLVIVLIRRRRKRASQFIKTYAVKMEKWASLTIIIIACYIWIRITLKTFGLFQPFNAWFTEFLTTTWTAGTIEISVEAIFDFIVIMILTFVIVHVFKIFLDMEIYPRIKFPRGIPGAISMVAGYILVTIGLIIALSSLGINLGKFGLLAGAIGVGLGFGLQNIIANFISGIVLAFERPIQVGDTVEIDTVYGKVQSIGVRSSTVKTFDNSEVIVPNANLISNRVTNWTLSDRRRRMELPVKVAFGHDPHQVLDLILEVAKEHPEVLDNPPPFAVFNGFGDYYLDFTLYYYIPTDIFFKAKSEIALGVHDLLKSKGINTPRPQRDIRMITLPGNSQNNH